MQHYCYKETINPICVQSYFLFDLCNMLESSIGREHTVSLITIQILTGSEKTSYFFHVKNDFQMSLVIKCLSWLQFSHSMMLTYFCSFVCIRWLVYIFCEILLILMMCWLQSYSEVGLRLFIVNKCFCI